MSLKANLLCSFFNLEKKVFSFTFAPAKSSMPESHNEREEGVESWRNLPRNKEKKVVKLFVFKNLLLANLASQDIVPTPLQTDEF